MGRAVYKKERPNLTIKCTGGANLGNCYNASYFEVTSTRKLDGDTIKGLRDLGFLGCGQEFRIISKCDGTEESAGYDVVLCVDEDTGEQAMNPYSDPPHPYEPHRDPYYVYKVERRVDSGD